MKAFVGWRSSTDDKCRQKAGDGWSNNVIHWGSLLILRSFTITIEVIGSRAEDEAEGEDQCNIKHCMHRRAAKETYFSWRRMNLTAIVFILVYAKRNERFVFSFLPSFRIYILSKGIDLSISEWVIVFLHAVVVRWVDWLIDLSSSFKFTYNNLLLITFKLLLVRQLSNWLNLILLVSTIIN